MKTQSPQARFHEALPPIGLPDLPATPASGQRPSRTSQLKDVAATVGRWITISATVAVIHVAALRYIFLPG
jgi:hypothetical protein